MSVSGWDAPAVTSVAGESTEDIAFDADTEEVLPADPVLGRAGQRSGERFSGRRMLRAVVLACWLATFAWAATYGFARVQDLAPGTSRWLLVAGIGVLGVALLGYFSAVEDPDIPETTSAADFHELEWSRRQLYAVRPRDAGWAICELAPLVAFFLV